MSNKGTRNTQQIADLQHITKMKGGRGGLPRGTKPRVQRRPGHCAKAFFSRDWKPTAKVVTAIPQNRFVRRLMRRFPTLPLLRLWRTVQGVDAPCSRRKKPSTVSTLSTRIRSHTHAITVTFACAVSHVQMQMQMHMPTVGTNVRVHPHRHIHINTSTQTLTRTHA